jgi:solute carrier family 25 (mitochondrial adenine nucleotide translocator), member 4/5/6/31
MINFMAGGVSGAIAKTATAPIERVKLIIQTQDANPKIISGEVKRYNGIVDCFTRVAKEQGIGAFWRGNLTNIIRYFPTQAFNFAFKDTIKAMFPKADKNTEFGKFFMINMASGGLAGAGSLMIVYPLDYARTRLASDVGSGKQQFSGLYDCLSKTVKTSGISGLYNGVGVSVVGIIPYRGVYFGLFDTLSGYNPYQKEENAVIRASSKFACAQFSAISAGYASYPFDTVRRRLQMQSENEGIKALFKGAGANALRTVGAALVLVMYSEITGAVGTGE